MMKPLRIHVLLFAIILLGGFAVAAEEFEFKIPKGWVFREASLSQTGLKAVLFNKDAQYEGEASNNIPSRLIIFDKDKTIINDQSYPETKHMLMTRGDNIVLMSGIEETDKITILDSRGRHLFDMFTQGRRPYVSQLGNEIGLARFDYGAREDTIGPVSIIDGLTGEEKISFGPPSGKGITGYSGFLPIGEGGQFLVAAGATVRLRTYLHPEEILWEIENIGGNVKLLIPIGEDYVGVIYRKNDFSAQKHMAGIAVLDRHDGQILFRQESHNPKVGLWRILHSAVDISLEEGDLFFTSFKAGESIRVPKSSVPSAKWDLNGLKKYEMANKSKYDEKTDDSRHLIKSRQDILHITKIQYREKATGY